jgi:serine/threonine protein kinase
MSSVWEAWDERLQRRVALKRLHPQAGLGEAEARLAAERALREARITARLHHPHAVAVYDVVQHEGAPCLIMQYHPSKNMQRLIEEQGTLSVGEVARIGSEIGSALSAAHAAGIVHRDVKPGNILIADDGSARLTDFGISHAYGDVTLTSAGMVTGTPAYLAPEIARGAKSSVAADVFSLGATLYAALEGTSPVGTALDNPMEVLHRVASGQLRPPQRSGPLEPLLRRMLALDPRQRPPMAAVVAELSQVRAASAQSTAALPTRRPPQRVPPPSASTTVILPPARDGDVPTATPAPAAHRPRRRLAWAAAVAVVAALLVAGSLVLLATSLGQGSGGDNPPAADATVRHSAAGSSTHRTTARSKPSAKSASKPKPTTANTRNAPPAGSTPSEQIAAVRDYYSLLPDHTAEVWDRLTAGYQAQTGGRGNYERFWHGFDSVSITNERFSSGVVLADLTYTRDDGSQSSETRSFTLVSEDGILKIADSQVVNG